MLLNLVLAGLLVVICVAIHFIGLMAMLRVLRHRAARLRQRNSLRGQGGIILAVVLGLLLLHSLEIWAYGVAYIAIGALPDIHTALYFSITSFSTVGYGDVVLDPRWRLFGVTESVVGLLLLAWSTAFLIAIMDHMRTFEHHWLEDPIDE